MNGTGAFADAVLAPPDQRAISRTARRPDGRRLPVGVRRGDRLVSSSCSACWADIVSIDSSTSRASSTSSIIVVNRSGRSDLRPAPARSPSVASRNRRYPRQVFRAIGGRAFPHRIRPGRDSGADQIYRFVGIAGLSDPVELIDGGVAGGLQNGAAWSASERASAAEVQRAYQRRQR